MNKQSGFTLIELLVTMLISSILMSIVFTFMFYVWTNGRKHELRRELLRDEWLKNQAVKSFIKSDIESCNLSDIKLKDGRTWIQFSRGMWGDEKISFECYSLDEETRTMELGFVGVLPYAIIWDSGSIWVWRD